METLARRDPEIARLMDAETARARGTLSLTASENVSSPAVREALGGGLTDKYAEGYPDDRFYEGCEAVDRIEDVALARAKALFGAAWANVQPHSGSSANLAVLISRPRRCPSARPPNRRSGPTPRRSSPPPPGPSAPALGAASAA